MAKYGSMNNFELTRNYYSLQETINTIKKDIDNISSQIQSLLATHFDKNELFLEEISSTIELKAEIDRLKQDFALILEAKKYNNMKPIDADAIDTSLLKQFLKNNNLNHLDTYLAEFGVRKIEDILYMYESDLQNDGVSLIDARKCLSLSKKYIETETEF